MTPTALSPLQSVLVANRGEIARRVFRTARSMGMRCIAVFVDADADAPFVQEADESVRLPSSYLDADAVLAAADTPPETRPSARIATREEPRP